MTIVAHLGEIPPGPDGVRATLEIMARLAREGAKTLPVRVAAMRLVQHLPQRDYLAEVGAIHAFVRDRIRYVRDVRGVETVQDPERTLLLRAGDCDDKSTLVAALLLAIGHAAQLHAVGWRPGVYSHVYAETQVQAGGPWVALETTQPRELGQAPGGAVEHMTKRVG